MSRYKPGANRSPWETGWASPPKPGDRIKVVMQGREKSGKTWMSAGTHDSGPAYDFKVIADETKRLTESMKKFGEAARGVDVQVQLRQEQMVLKLIEMEDQIRRLEAEQKAQEDAELQEGIDYVMRSLGVTQ